MRLLLDTRVLLWALAAPQRLPDDIRALIEDGANDVLFSAASIWEVAIKSGLGRADLHADPAVAAQGARDAGFDELAVSAAHAAAARTLPPHHRDPFDRLLIAQALVEPAWLVTADRQMAAYDGPIRLIGTA